MFTLLLKFIFYDQTLFLYNFQLGDVIEKKLHQHPV